MWIAVTLKPKSFVGAVWKAKMLARGPLPCCEYHRAVTPPFAVFRAKYTPEYEKGSRSWGAGRTGKPSEDSQRSVDRRA